MNNRLFTPLKIGPNLLDHRVVMAPLTRMRAAQPGDIPRPLNATYYAQRASRGGLIIAEASQVSPVAQGVPASPGIYSREQVEGWRQVTEAVHKEGGVIYLQLWHVGRVSHSSLQPGQSLPVAPSAIPAEGQAITANFEFSPFEIPRELQISEIVDIVGAFSHAARNAHDAGFDGVEIHGANGYLAEQFLQSRSNHRSDVYGGSIANRSRFLLEVTDAVVGVYGRDRVGVRLSPYGRAYGSGETEPIPLYRHVIHELAKREIGYLHLIEPRSSGSGRADVDHKDVPSAAELFRRDWPGVLIAAGNFSPETAAQAVDRGIADAIAFGRHFIANPDLPERLRSQSPLNPYNRATFYGGNEEGYTDYPALPFSDRPT
ncbi:alkene reductase [Paraburkholderia tropica]|uniref:alkene reductase n=1 Tax=Paraburkholderia tropica TaxID=92647 RepID=UPI002ABE6A2D|nr:alkene reductase [Paraburkholderia tropica]